MNEVVYEHRLPSGHLLQLVHGDITEERVDAIVNAANSYLKHSGGVAGAIVRKGGKVIQEESDKIGYVPVGEVAMTTAGALPAKAVIHAVGPQWGEGNEDEKLKSAVYKSLKMADEKGFESIALPAISAGIFGFPKDRCAAVILQTITEFCSEHKDSKLRIIRITIIDEPTLRPFLNKFIERFGEEGKSGVA
ncbi:MAG: macro domain-containing protein [Armatimonadota bacterium]|nr:macro domain-containing protein [Armatimonadota bacterium]MCX7778081.1 macro domain-containing protein [Armatimonadota bacterium]MDW8025468.1 macro domain-containing protein [Armatimonadota bacterium]